MQSICILIAHDDPMTRQCVRRAVEEDPRLHICGEADNGLQAILLARQHDPHLVLMDAQMPRMDGFEATRCLRQQGRSVRILVLNVYENQHDLALAAGADACVTKDCGCDIIREAVYNILGGLSEVAEAS
jgi:two-component system nitrate/nitrite response regulator NarP